MRLRRQTKLLSVRARLSWGWRGAFWVLYIFVGRGLFPTMLGRDDCAWAPGSGCSVPAGPAGPKHPAHVEASRIICACCGDVKSKLLAIDAGPTASVEIANATQLRITCELLGVVRMTGENETNIGQVSGEVSKLNRAPIAALGADSAGSERAAERSSRPSPLPFHRSTSAPGTASAAARRLLRCAVPIAQRSTCGRIRWAVGRRAAHEPSCLQSRSGGPILASQSDRRGERPTRLPNHESAFRSQTRRRCPEPRVGLRATEQIVEWRGARGPLWVSLR